MESYKIEITRSAKKEIQSLEATDRKRIVAKILALSSNPRGPDSKKLSNNEYYRVRVGVFRILYEIIDHRLVVTVVRVAHRSKVYR